MNYRVLGLSSGNVDAETDEMSFDLKIGEQSPMSFIAAYAPAAQMIGALGRMHVELCRVLLEKKTMKASCAEVVESSFVERDPWAGVVLMQLTSRSAVPYTFAIDPKLASEIAHHLKTESAKGGKPGNA
jgi:hypothetical protein